MCLGNGQILLNYIKIQDEYAVLEESKKMNSNMSATIEVSTWCLACIHAGVLEMGSKEKCLNNGVLATYMLPVTVCLAHN